MEKQLEFKKRIRSSIDVNFNETVSVAPMTSMMSTLLARFRIDHLIIHIVR